MNGHGSNVPYLDIAARNITIETQAIAAMIPWWNLVPKELFKELRESEFPGRDGPRLRTRDVGFAVSAR